MGASRSAQHFERDAVPERRGRKTREALTSGLGSTSRSKNNDTEQFSASNQRHQGLNRSATQMTRREWKTSTPAVPDLRKGFIFSEVGGPIEAGSRFSFSNSWHQA